MRVNRTYNYIISISILILSSSTLYCQSNKMTDSLLLMINKKVDNIEKKMNNTIPMSKESEKDVDLKKELKELKKQHEELKKQTGELTKQIAFDKKRNDSILVVLKNANNKLDQELKQQKSNQQVKEKDNQSFIENEKLALEREIAAILNQGYTLPLSLLNSFEERYFDAKVKPTNYNLLKDYIDAHKKLNDAYTVLNNAYDANKINVSLSIIEKINLDASLYAGLMANKKEVIPLLKEYCKRTNELSKKFEAAAVLSDQTKREEWLLGFSSRTEGYPYLFIQFELAIKDRNYKLEKVNCQ